MLKALKINSRHTKLLFDSHKVGDVMMLSPGHVDVRRLDGSIGHYSTWEAAILSFVGIDWRHHVGPRMSGVHKCHYEPYHEPIHKKRWARS